MFNRKFLSLSGLAHLHDIRCHRTGERLITLNLINECDNSRSDDIWIECHLNMIDFPVMARLERLMTMEKSIILKFDAKYSGLHQYYRGMSKDDPETILQLQGKLLKIHEYYVEGENIPYWHSHDFKNDFYTNRLGDKL